ncbi:hypothetical protein BDP27DRAFT_1444965 [Rhodocollybia butyracea]|uniref:Histone chaperone domain-containing protein n=1 Tax=Rhodocollybia butyracea TaxID=206335 RepID=A0A9P5UCY2_9AGAR|nr:hypothetical protein BDP27DRAFT_1444965 [Rhodocollybia butyracea]
MSTDATDSTAATKNSAAEATKPVDASPSNKGKGKASKEDESMEEDDDDDDDDEDDDDEDGSEEEEEEEDSMAEIDPTAILAPGRRTRGVKVDYTSAEALKKAGLKDQKDEDDEDEEMKEV